MPDKVQVYDQEQANKDTVAVMRAYFKVCTRRLNEWQNGEPVPSLADETQAKDDAVAYIAKNVGRKSIAPCWDKFQVKMDTWRHRWAHMRLASSEPVVLGMVKKAVKKTTS